MISTIKSLLWRKPAVRTETRIEAKVVDIGDLTSGKWRENPINVEAARKVLNDPTLKLMLAIAGQESPLESSPRPFGSSAEDIQRGYGEEFGYRHALAKLQSFGLPIPKSEDLEPEFKDDRV